MFKLCDSERARARLLVTALKGFPDRSTSVEWSAMDSPSARSADATASWFGWSDWVGMMASIGCAIHCATMPFAFAYLPTLGLSFLADEAFHQWMAIACLAIALTAFIPGLRKHGRLTPVIVGSIGLVMISAAAFGFAGECCMACESHATRAASVGDGACGEACCEPCAIESAVALTGGMHDSPVILAYASSGFSPWLALAVPWLTPLGGMVLVCAHLLNRRYGCLCGCCDSAAAKEVA